MTYIASQGFLTACDIIIISFKRHLFDLRDAEKQKRILNFVFVVFGQCLFWGLNGRCRSARASWRASRHASRHADFLR